MAIGGGSNRSPKGEPNPLFYGQLVVVVAAVVSGVLIPAERAGIALNSKTIFHVEAAALVWAVGYVVVAGLWLAWHRRLFKRLPFPGLGNAETHDDGDSLPIDELEKRDEEAEEFRKTTRDALATLGERVARLEGRNER